MSTSWETKVGLAPFANWYLNCCSDIWTSPTFFQDPLRSVVLPTNSYYTVEAGAFLAYGARNCVIICQIHWTTIRFNNWLKAFSSIHEKVNAVSFARCLKSPKLFIGSNQGNALIYHIEKNVIQTLNCVDVARSELPFDATISSVDWADNVDVFYSKSNFVIQWNTDDNVFSTAQLQPSSGLKCKIDSIRVSRVDPLLLVVAFAGGEISIFKLEGGSLRNRKLLTTLNIEDKEILSMAFPFSNGTYENGMLAAVSRNGIVKVWELDSRNILAEQHFATKADKFKSKPSNFFAINFVPKPPANYGKKSETNKTNGKDSESNKTDQQNEEESESKTVENENGSGENDSIFRLLASRADGRIVVIDVPSDKQDLKSSSLKRPDTICQNRLWHHNTVFNIPVINPYHYIKKGATRTIQPFWDMKLIAASFSLDRQIIIYDLKRLASCKPMFPTLSLQVHDLDFYPVDFTKLLIACGDGIKIWYFNHNARDLPTNGPANYKLENVSKVPPATKIVSAAWHPHNVDGETIIGFGTDEGTFYAIELQKSVLVYSAEWRLHESGKTRVYSCKWGPIPSDFTTDLKRKWACYTVYAAGNVRAHVVTDSKAFNLDQLSNDTLARNDLNKTECVWKDDYNYIAVGYEDGQIYICVNDGHFRPAIILDIHSSVVTCIRWHPDNVCFYDNQIKTRVIYKDKTKYESWIASGSKDLTVEMTDLKMDLMAYHEMGKNEPILVKKSTHTLRGHQSGIVSLAWNNVSEDLLASCSADTTVIVWQVGTEIPTTIFSGHWSRVFAIAWAPWSSDLIFSAGDDSTVQVWSPSELSRYVEPVLPGENGREVERIDSPLPDESDSSPVKNGQELHDVIDDNPPLDIESSGEHAAELSQILASEVREIINFPIGVAVKDITAASSESQSSTKTSPKSIISSRPPSSMASSKPAGSIISKLRNAEKAIAEISHKDKKKSLFPLSNSVENCSTKVQTLQDIEFLLSERYKMGGFDVSDAQLRTRNLLFLDSSEVSELCQVEIENHKQNKNFSLAHQISSLQGNYESMITEAVKTSQLSDWMVAQAASVSRSFWAKTVLAYAIQLEKAGEPLQAALYYSTINKNLDAIRVLIKAGQFKEALVLIKSRDPHNAQLIKDIFREWALIKQRDSNNEFAAKIHVANMEPAEASKLLGERLDDPKCQQLKRLLDSSQELEVREEKDPDPPV